MLFNVCCNISGQQMGILVFCRALIIIVLLINFVRMTNLLRKFRIAFSAVIEVHGVNSLPSSQRYCTIITEDE